MLSGLLLHGFVIRKEGWFSVCQAQVLKKTLEIISSNFLILQKIKRRPRKAKTTRPEFHTRWDWVSNSSTTDIFGGQILLCCWGQSAHCRVFSSILVYSNPLAQLWQSKVSQNTAKYPQGAEGRAKLSPIESHWVSNWYSSNQIPLTPKLALWEHLFSNNYFATRENWLMH